MGETRSKSELVVVAVAAAALAVLYLGAADGEYHFMEGASAEKIMQVRGLLSGAGYYEIGRVGVPPEVLRPPGFALVLAGVELLFGEDMLALKLFNNLFAPLGFLAAYFLLRRRAGAWPAIAISFSAYLFPFTYAIARYLESEFLFSLLLFAAMAVFERARDREFIDLKLLGLFAALLAAAVMIRTVAFVLVPASFLALFFQPAAPARRRLAWAGAITLAWLVVGGGWMLRNQQVSAPGELTYVDKVLVGEPVQSVYWLALDHRMPLLPKPRPAGPMDIAVRLAANLSFFTQAPLRETWPGSASWGNAGLLIVALPALLFLLGLGRGLWKERRLPDFTLLFYLGVILLYPHQDTRFLVPVLPFLILYPVEAVAAGLRYFLKQGERKSMVTTLILCMALGASFFIQDMRRLGATHYDLPAIVRSPHFRITSPNPGAYHSAVLLDWVHQHSSPNDRVLFHSFAACAVLTERQCSGIPMVDPSRLMQYLDDAGITLVVVDDEARYGPAYTSAFTAQYLIPALKKYPERFETLISADGSSARVMRVVRP